MAEQEKPRGTAAMDPQTREEVSRKGGEAVSQDREHMAEIGRKGGEASGGQNQTQGQGENLSQEDRVKGGENSRKAG